MAAAQTLIAMTTQSRRATMDNSVHHLAVLPGQVRSVPLPEAAARYAEDVGHLKGGPGHLLARLLDRFMSSEVDT